MMRCFGGMLPGSLPKAGRGADTGGPCRDNEHVATGRKVHIRPPGVKTGSKVGPLGPFRGTLGIQWVVGSIAVGLLIVLAVTWLLFRAPGAPYQRVGPLERFTPGTATEVLDNVFLSRAEDGEAFAVTSLQPNCPLETIERGLADCAGRKYTYDGQAFNDKRSPLPRLPIRVHRGEVYVDTSQLE
jgi:hypothetical protein